MRRLVATLLLAWAVALLAVPAPVLAQNPAAADPAQGRAPSFGSLRDGITLHAPTVIKTGREIDVDAILAIGGVLRPDADLHFIIDDIERRMVRTNAQGTAHFRLRGVLTSGSHELLVRFNGTKRSFWSGSVSAAATFVVAPLIITIQTVPALPGITFALDSGKAVSDAAGEAILGVARAGFHTLAVRLPAPNQSTHISFTRWSDESWTLSRPIRVMYDVSISVGLRVAYLTPIRFVGLDGNPLDPARVFDVVISGPDAEVIQLQFPYEPIWLQTPIVGKHAGESGLHITQAPYTLSFAKYDRLNVASTGQMRYFPVPGGTWKIPLLLFTLRLGARDAIFGTTLNNSIRLVGPTGRAQSVSLNGRDRVSLVLSRGNYTAQVLASGVTPVASIALSRSQEVVIPVITPIDLSTVALILLVIVAVVFVAGRGRFWAVGKLSAVHARYGEPIIVRWEGHPLRSSVAQFVATAVTGRLNRRRAAFTSEEDALPSQQAFVAARAISTFPRSYLLAHDTGHGPTLELGSILRGLIDSGKAERFLLVVHQSQLAQWQRHLMEKFSLNVPRFERNTFRDSDGLELEWSGNPWNAFPIVLASSDLARRRDRRNELLAAGPWDVVLADNAEEAHRSGSKRTGAPNKLLAVLQAMKANHSWKALYLASAARPQLQLHEVSDLMSLLGLTDLPAEVESDLARYFSIPLSERPDGDWEFLRQICADFVGDGAAVRSENTEGMLRKFHNVAGSRQARRTAANGTAANGTAANGTLPVSAPETSQERWLNGS
jgi:Type III restriction enzyme, res subunit